MINICNLPLEMRVISGGEVLCCYANLTGWFLFIMGELALDIDISNHVC